MTTQALIMEDDSLFTLDNVSRFLGEKKILENVTLNIPRGKVIFVCGLSASGKSTLLNLLGLLRPGIDGGEVTLRLPGRGEIQYSRVTPRQQIELRARAFGFVLQSSYLLPYLSGHRNVGMPLAIHNSLPRKTWTERIEQLLKNVSGELLKDSERLPHSLSGGQRQRLSVLRAIVHDPSVVFADEPCASLDHQNREVVMRLLHSWRNGEMSNDMHVKSDPTGDGDRDRTLIIVSHDVDSVLEHADLILVVRQSEGIEMVARESLGDDPRKARLVLEQKMDGRLLSCRGN